MTLRKYPLTKILDSDSCILPSSKKISKLPKDSFSAKKTKITADLEDADGLLSANSDIFSKKEKLQVLEELRSRISQVKGLELIYSSSQGNSSPEQENIDWLKCLDKLGPETFNVFLNEVIPQCKPRMALTKKSLVQLRRRVRSWFKADEKPEVKGRAVVPPKELPGFVNAMREILNEMKVKSFKELKVKVQGHLQELYQRLGREFKGNEFSKHYWWEFQESHKSIKELWKALPQKRAKKGAAFSAPKTQYSTMSTCGSLDGLSPSPLSNSMEVEDQIINNMLDNTEESEKWSDDIDFEKLQSNFDFMDNIIMESPDMKEEYQTQESDDNWLADLKKEWEQSNQITSHSDAFPGLF